MPEPAWKTFERRISKYFGGVRRGSTTNQNGSGKSDIIATGWSVECKLYSRPCYQDLLNAARQAEANAETPADIPVAITKRKGDLDKDSLVVMRLETFKEFFINEVKDDV